jgi:hypothetical protein
LQNWRINAALNVAEQRAFHSHVTAGIANCVMYGIGLGELKAVAKSIFLAGGREDRHWAEGKHKFQFDKFAYRRLSMAEIPDSLMSTV